MNFWDIGIYIYIFNFVLIMKLWVCVDVGVEGKNGVKKIFWIFLVKCRNIVK